MITELTPYIGGSAVTGVLGLLIRFGHQLWTTSLALKKTEEGSVTEITLSKHRRVRVDRSNRVMPHEHPTPERHEVAKTQDANGRGEPGPHSLPGVAGATEREQVA